MMRLRFGNSQWLLQMRQISFQQLFHFRRRLKPILRIFLQQFFDDVGDHRRYFIIDFLRRCWLFVDDLLNHREWFFGAKRFSPVAR